MSYFYREESAKIPYSVKVQPGPTADEAKALLHKNRPDGPVAKTEPLSKQGQGVLQLPLKSFELTDSPVFIEFQFKSKGNDFKTVRALALADPVPEKCAPDPPLADPGETVTLKVTAWTARVFDQPGNASETLEPEPERVPQKARSEVRWQVDGKKLDPKGEQVTFTVEAKHRGREIPVEAFLGEKPTGRATTKVDCRAKVKLVLKDANDQPIASTKCVFTKQGTTEEANTDGGGIVKTIVPKLPSRFLLRVDNPDPAFDVDVPIVVGELPASSTRRGQQARLRNLGYYVGELAGVDEDRPDEDEDPFAFPSAVEEFQCDHGLPVNGTVDAATKAKLEEEHGS